MVEIALIGTGEIGSRFAHHLVAAGHGVRAYDLRPEGMEAARAAGAVISRSAGLACKGADLAITCVTDGEALREVVEGKHGILSSGERLAVIDTTSAEPWISAALADRLADAGIGFLDAPVSGGVPAAEEARVNFMVGGDPALLERWRSVLSVLGTDIAHVGPAGSGHTLKALNMMALAGNMLITLEALALGIAEGLSPPDVIEGLRTRGAGSYACRVHFPKFILPGNFASGFGFDLMLKDLSIGLGVLERAHQCAPVCEEVLRVYHARASELAGRDNSLIAESYLRPAAQVDGAGPQSRLSRERLLDGLAGLVAFGQRLLAAELLATGAAVGLSPQLVVSVLCSGSGESDVLARSVPEEVLSASSCGSAGGAQLDAGAREVLDTARLHRISIPILRTAHEATRNASQLSCQK